MLAMARTAVARAATSVAQQRADIRNMAQNALAALRPSACGARGD